MSLKNKRILITAGPTRVNIDSVRVISNTASGVTGILLSQALAAKKSKVTLLLGPVGNCSLGKNIKLLRFERFEELKNIIVKELRGGSYDIMIHTAAVSDYKPRRIYTGKVASGIKGWKINLIPTEKIISLIKPIDRYLVLVAFKFEPEAKFADLIKESRRFLKHSDADLVVANTLNKDKYRAFIADRNNRILAKADSKKKMAERLVNIINKL